MIHHGLLLGEDGKKLSKRHGGTLGRRPPGRRASPQRPSAPTSTSSDSRRTTSSLDRGRLGRLAIDAIAAMSDEELAAAADAPPELARALRGARTLVEAREIARQILAPEPVDARR